MSPRNQLLESATGISYWNQLLESATGISYWNQLLESATGELGGEHPNFSPFQAKPKRPLRHCSGN